MILQIYLKSPQRTVSNHAKFGYPTSHLDRIERWASRKENLAIIDYVSVNPASNYFLESYSEFGDRLFDIVDNTLYQQESFFRNIVRNYFNRVRNT